MYYIIYYDIHDTPGAPTLLCTANWCALRILNTLLSLVCHSCKNVLRKCNTTRRIKNQELIIIDCDSN